MALYFVNFSDFPLLALVVEPVGTISLKDRKKNAFFYNKYKEKQRVIFNRYRYRWYENISKQNRELAFPFVFLYIWQRADKLVNC